MENYKICKKEELNKLTFNRLFFIKQRVEVCLLLEHHVIRLPKIFHAKLFFLSNINSYFTSKAVQLKYTFKNKNFIKGFIGKYP